MRFTTPGALRAPLATTLLWGLLALALPAHAQVVFDDGGVHDISTDLGTDSVLVQNGTTVNVLSGASFGDPLVGPSLDIQDSSTVNISGGTIANDVLVQGVATLNVSGGSLADDLEARDDSRVDVSGGTIGDDLQATDDSRVTLSGGTVDDDLVVRDDAWVTFQGGTVGNDIEAKGRALLDIAGGVLVDQLELASLSSVSRAWVRIFGADFELDEVPVPDGDVTDTSGALTAILEEGDFLDTFFFRHPEAKLTLVSDSTPDADGDGVTDLIDVCPTEADPFQIDFDGDWVGDHCDVLPNDADNDIDDSQAALAAALAATPDCSDGLDNDGDGGVDDGDDTGCDGPDDPSELDPAVVCDNGLDDDGDGLRDFPLDPGCSRPLHTVAEDTQCNDGIDNDGDGAIDFDGGAILDQDGDGFVDAQFNSSQPAVTAPDSNCPTGSKNTEATSRRSCGLGFELVVLLPVLTRLRRRRSR